MTRDAILDWITKNDMHLYGTATTLKEAAKALGISKNVLRSVLYSDNGKLVTKYWFVPDYSSGPRKATPDKHSALSWRKWEKLRYCMTDNEALFTSPGATAAFIIRWIRSPYRLPANMGILKELFALRKLKLNMGVDIKPLAAVSVPG